MSQQNRGRGGPRGRGAPSGAGRGSGGPRTGPAAAAATSNIGFSDRGRGFARGAGQGPRGSGGPPRGSGGTGRGMGRGGPGAPAQVFAANTPARVDQRLNEVDQLVSSFKRLGVQDEKPLRPGFGTLGRPQVLRANFFAIKTTLKIIYDYDIAFTPKAQAGNERRARILQILEREPQYAPYVGFVAHDRSQRLVAAKKLPQPLSFQVQYLEEGETNPRPNALTFTVEIGFQRELKITQSDQYMQGRPESRNEDLLPLMSALNLVLQQHAANTGIRVGKNRYFFGGSSTPMQLSLGVEAWRGFFISVRPTFKQLMVNVNVCMTAFYTAGNLADAMIMFRNQSGGGMPSRFYDKLKVSTTHLGYIRKKAIFRIERETARQSRFQCDELGGKVTVEEYFKKKYNITLRHAHDLPLVNIGNKDKPNLVPAELCQIVPGQAYRGKLSPNETSQMIRFACNPPAYNAATICDQGFQDLGLTGNNVLNGFGITVSREMTAVPSRVLPPPGLSYKQGSANVREASWNIVNIKFHSPATVSSWAVLLVQDGGRNEFRGRSDPQLQTFLQTFLQKLRSSGMTVPTTPPQILETGGLPRVGQDPGRRQALQQIKDTLTRNLDRNKKPSFILVLLSGVDNYIYPGIKRLGDVELGLSTVHMLLDPKKALAPGNKQDQYFSNVALKVNIKLGGINHKLNPQAMAWLTKMKTMIVGIDVTHPGPASEKGTPSIAAVVASYDNDFVQYPASLRPQKPDWNKEAKEVCMVENLTEMMIERLQVYRQKNKALPDRILIFRDGVSEGQYDLVLKEELPRIREAFRKISPTPAYKPKLTIIICGKRHHARFNATADQDMTKNGNTLPGTVQDKGITDVYGFDYYLQAHAGLQGHVRPTHYYVVYDDFHYDADTIQQGTHTTSYLYARATKAVSLVPPAYYADLACERARYYLNDLLNLADERSSAGSRGRDRDSEAEKERIYQEAMRLWGTGIHTDMRGTMFYI
ncbi:Piwi-domain-containing protein [Wolfiporia cocos MD-104 SS10]|uniref:Piwi-domain-containing protein n=1 Tax=Wolfiporia cocos (strain MD-104) TaxID=742152 RepID=A0A2H3JFN5_WOLCO|nr:Piwi-domain-containing protein [Wolfiporia cocos MD-104 SS10]